MRSMIRFGMKPLGVAFCLALMVLASANSVLGADSVRVVLLDGPVDIDHPAIAPFIDFKALRSIQMRSGGETPRLSEWHRSQIHAYFKDRSEESLDDLYRQIQGYRSRAPRLWENEDPEFKALIHGTATASVLVKDLSPETLHLIPLPMATTDPQIIASLEPQIVVMPFSFVDSEDSPGELSDELKTLIDMMRLNRQTIFVLAAGNDGRDLHTGRLLSPALLQQPNLIKVGALARNETMAPFSNFSSTYVDILAPGEEIEVLAPRDHGHQRKIRLSGTSFSAPYVAREIALLLHESFHPTQPAETLQKLGSRVQRLPWLWDSARQGRALVPLTSSNPCVLALQASGPLKSP